MSLGYNDLDIYIVFLFYLDNCRMIVYLYNV